MRESGGGRRGKAEQGTGSGRLHKRHLIQSTYLSNRLWLNPGFLNVWESLVAGMIEMLALLDGKATWWGLICAWKRLFAWFFSNVISMQMTLSFMSLWPNDLYNVTNVFFLPWRRECWLSPPISFLLFSQILNLKSSACNLGMNLIQTYLLNIKLQKLFDFAFLVKDYLKKIK